MEKKNVLVVGGSSGIGLEIVRLLAANGHHVYVGSRNNRALVGLADVGRLRGSHHGRQARGRHGRVACLYGHVARADGVRVLVSARGGRRGDGA